MEKPLTLTVKIENGPLKNKKFDVDVPVEVSKKDLAKINVDGAFVAGGSFMAAVSALGAIGGTGMAVATVGTLTITASIISATIGVIGAVVALGVFVPAIVKLVRDANTTSFILLNVVPNSTMRIKKVNLQKGAWVHTDDAAILRDEAEASDKEAAALVFQAQPYRSGGEVKGFFEVTLHLDKSKKSQTFKVHFDNPLGVDTKNRKASYSTDLPTNANHSGVLFSPTPHVDHPKTIGPAGGVREKERADIVTFVIAPTYHGL